MGRDRRGSCRASRSRRAMWRETLDCTVNSAHGRRRERAVVGDGDQRRELPDLHGQRADVAQPSPETIAGITNVLLARSSAPMCVYSQAHTDRRDTPPMYRSMEPTNVDPPSTGFRLRGPVSPAGLLPFSWPLRGFVRAATLGGLTLPGGNRRRLRSRRLRPAGGVRGRESGSSEPRCSRLSGRSSPPPLQAAADPAQNAGRCRSGPGPPPSRASQPRLRRPDRATSAR